MRKTTSLIIEKTAQKASTKAFSTTLTKSISSPVFIIGDVAELGTRLLIKDPKKAE